MKSRYFFAAALAAASVPANAQTAQDQQALAVEGGQPFRHANSGITIPPTLAGLPLTSTKQYEAPELDVMFEFSNASEVLSLYIYRAPSGSIPVWFDRGVWAAETQSRLGALSRVAIGTLPTPHQSVEAGMYAVWKSQQGPYTATALALAPLGQWIVKLRYSTKSADAGALAARLPTIYAELQWPQAVAQAPAAKPVEACATALRFQGRAKPVKPDGAAVLLGAVLSQMAASPEPPADASEGSPTLWCRDPAQVENAAVYRANASTDSYLIALSDAGRGISVSPSAAGTLLGKGKDKPNWNIDLILPGRTLNFPAVDRLPAPPQAVEALRGKPVSAVTTWGKDRNVEVQGGAFAK